MKNRSRILAVATLAIFLAAPAAAQRAIRINLGTVVPEGSVWHEILLQMKQDWTTLSNGRVRLNIFAGGKLGDDADMLRQVRIGKLQALALTGIGLSLIDSNVDALHIPMLFDSYEELDYVRDRLAPDLEAVLSAKGYTVLNWSDGGWVHFFTKKPAKTLDDLRGMKLWISAGDPRTEKLYRDFDFQVVAVPVTDAHLQLQTGAMNAIQMPPLFAMLDRFFERAEYMTNIRWAQVMGGTVISNKAWERIPAELRPKLLEAAQRAGQETRARIRKLGDDSIAQMVERGLVVVEADREAWLREATEVYPRLRGRLAPQPLFDKAIRLRDEYRASSGGH